MWRMFIDPQDFEKLFPPTKEFMININMQCDHLLVVPYGKQREAILFAKSSVKPQTMINMRGELII
jgi:hypothetical protein